MCGEMSGSCNSLTRDFPGGGGENLGDGSVH